MSLFKLGGQLDKKQTSILGIAGFLFILLVWYLLTMGASPVIREVILPKPISVFKAFGEMFIENSLIKNICHSVGFNLAGYAIALIIAIPVGFMIGLFPFFRGTLQSPIDALRFVPLPAAISIFMGAFGIGAPLIVNFLAFGIMIYLIPVVVQRIDEVNSVYLKTVHTIGATDWQTIKTVYIPSVLSRLSDDIRILTAISWTYITAAEVIGAEGGLGDLAYKAGARFGRYDKVYAILIIIIIIGVLQDKLFGYMDKKFFAHKYQNKNRYATEEEDSGLEMIIDFGMEVLVWSLFALYLFLVVNQFTGTLQQNGEPILTYLFGRTTWVIHLIMFLIIFFKGRKLLSKVMTPKAVTPKA